MNSVVQKVRISFDLCNAERAVCMVSYSWSDIDIANER